VYDDHVHVLQVFQRQISKEGLQALVSSKGGGSSGAAAGGAGGSGGGGKQNLLSAEELRELFTLHSNTVSHTYEMVAREMAGGRSGGGAADDGGAAPQPLAAEEEGAHGTSHDMEGVEKVPQLASGQGAGLAMSSDAPAAIAVSAPETDEGAVCKHHQQEAAAAAADALCPDGCVQHHTATAATPAGLNIFKPQVCCF
jgi:hypothetical protein